MAKGKLLISFWTIDEDTQSCKDGSRWFDFDSDREVINIWLNDHPGRVVEETKYFYDRSRK